MRIVIDMQGMQTGSRHRGIGRYTQALVKAILRQGRDHQIFLLLNGLFADTIEPTIHEFAGHLPLERIKVWHAIGPTADINPSNVWRRELATFMRREKLRQLAPDMVLLTTLFEGFGDDFVASIEGHEEGAIPVATILYDLIPLLNPKEYLADDRVRQWYHTRVEMLKRSRILLAISESSKSEGHELLGFPDQQIVNISSAVDETFRPLKLTPQEAAQFRQSYGIPKEYLMYSGATDPRKNHIRLIQAYAKLPQEIQNNHQLVIVGGMPEDHKVAFQDEAKRCGLSESDCRIVGRVDDESLVKFYTLCKGYVFPSWHEGFGLPALEAINCGRPVIAANTSSLPEVVGVEAALFDPFDTDDMAAKMAKLLSDTAFRDELVQQQTRHAQNFSWDLTAKRAMDAMAQAIGQENPATQKASATPPTPDYAPLAQQLAPHAAQLSDAVLMQIAAMLAQEEQDNTQRELLVDVSELVKHDAHTGIQRVTRAILKELHELQPHGMRVRPVFATPDQGYQYAKALPGIDGATQPEAPEGPIRLVPGDIFLGLDLIHPAIAQARRETFSRMRQQGVRAFFVVYDLIPVLYPQYANTGVPEGHAQWLDVVTEADGAICISRTVANELNDWLQKHKPGKVGTFQIGHFHLGADIENSVPTRGLPDNATSIQSAMQKRPSYLMVGTLEPRKGHPQVIQAFETLWAKGHDANLIIVGKPGWKMDNLFETIDQHPENGQRLFWMHNTSDEYLQQLYANATALIAASYCEGYGLPLIEAARQKLPVIARDIPVFREVAQDHASYFQDSSDPKDLADAMSTWQAKWQLGQHPQSDAMVWLTWKQSTRMLVDSIFDMDKAMAPKEQQKNN